MSEDQEVNPGAQEEAIGFLERLGGKSSRTITTHISIVVLAGDRAFKLKRCVVFPYLDFSTPDVRLAMCEKEYELNRRTAPKLYLGVRRITREADGGLAFDGRGELIDAVVEMRRFEEDALFENLSRRGALTRPLIEGLARRIATFHDAANVDYSRGGFSGMSSVLALNDASARAAQLASPEELDALSETFRQAAEKYADLLDARRAHGKVRRCHGDLTLRNICLLDGEPTPFDCIEFSENLATIDVLYDLAFLLMDLWRADERGFANIALNRYLDHCDETDGLPLIPFFMAVRAMIRAHVTAAQAMQTEKNRDALIGEARSYFDLARSLLRPEKALIVAIGGLSGSGKSSIAARLAPLLGAPPGARVLNSDRLRKKMFGVEATTRLPPEAYAPEISARVYEILRKEAGRAASNDWMVIVDAVFDRPDDRRAIEAIARDRHVPFAGFWLEVSHDLGEKRVTERRNDVSDATREVLLLQRAREIGEMGWTRIDASRTAEDVARDVAERLDALPFPRERGEG